MATSNWASLGAPGTISANPSIGKNDDGRLEAFVWTVGVDAAKDLWHIWQTAPNGTWSNWASLGGPSTGFILEGSTIVVQNDDGRLEVFATGPDYALLHIWQVAPNGSWSNWNSLGKPTNEGIRPPFSVHVNDDGRLEVFATDIESALWHIWQTAPNGPWSNWASLGTPSKGSLSAPFVRKNDDGRLEVFTIGSDGALWHIWQTTTGGAWGNWGTLGTPSSSVNALGDPFVAENDDGRLEAFSVGSDDALWHTWQVSPGGHWGS